MVGERGADPNKGGQIPILYAALYARKDFIELLINNNANILLKDKSHDYNVLHYVLSHLNKCRKHISDIEEIVKYCLEKNSVLVKDANIFGMTPLHFAAEHGSASIVKMLLDYGADVNAKSHLAKPLCDVSRAEANIVRHVKNYDEGYTPLHIAAKENHLESVKLLLQKGAIYRAINDERSTPLDMAELGSDVESLLESISLSFKAVLDGKKDELDYLLKGKGSDVLKSILNARDRDKRTLLQVAGNEKRDITNLLIEKLRNVPSSDQQQEAVKQGGKVSAGECLPGPSSGRRKREAIGEKCLFTWEDVDEFNEEKDEKRDFSKMKIDSEKFVSYIKDLPEAKQSQLIQLADEVRVAGNSQGLVSKLISNQKVMSHLNRVGRISGMTMHGMMAKNVLADFLNGDYQGVAVNVGFIAGGQGFAKVAEAASLKGLKLAQEGKLLVGRSLRAASPFLARGTSAFVVYDLVNQIKAFKNGTEEVLVGVVGDSIYLGVDAAEIGVEVAEAFEVLEGVSSVTGPIGATIGAVVFVGTDVYMAVKRVDKIDQIIHLKGNERFIEGLRAFIGMQPERYIEELMEEKQLSNQLVKQGLEYLQQHSNIQRYVFPTGKSVVDSCRDVPYQKSICSGGFNWCSARRTVTCYTEKCTTKFEVDLDNTVLLERKRTDVKWSRAKPDNPDGGQVFCLPQGDYEPAPNYGSYLCESAIGVTDLSANKTGGYTLINLGEGKDNVKGFTDSRNIFVVNNGSKEYYGGNKDDIFVLQAGYVKGYLSGEGGINTLDTTSFAFQEEPLNIQLDIGEIVDYSRDNWLRVCDINKVIGRENRAETITVSCNGCNSNVKLIDGQSGNKEIKDKINIVDNHCSYQMQVIVRPNTVIYNRALEGNFDYLVPLNEGGSAEFIFIFGPERFNVNNTFWFGYEPVDIKSINVRYVNIFNRTEHEVKFNFIKSEKEFNVTIPYAENPSYRLGKNGEIKIGNKDNLYMLQSSNESSEEIIKNYLPLASRLNKMSFFIQSLLSNETVVIGSGNHEVIHNNPAYRSHLVGNGGENVYVIDSESKRFEIPLPEVVIYDLDKESSVDTIDLRNLVQQARSKFSNKDSFELKVLESANDLLLKATVVEMEQTEDSSVSKIGKHEYFTVRLKDGVNWYNRTHVIVDRVPMRINLDNNEWSLKPQPLVFEKDKEVIIVTGQDVEKNTELIIPKKGGNYTFIRDHGTNLMITNAFDANITKEDLCTITLSKFYEEPKMETLSVKFADKEIVLKDHQEQINTARDMNIVKKEHSDQVYNDVFNSIKSEPEVIMVADQPMDHKHRHEHSRHRTRHRRSENITSSGARPSSWINDLFGWVKSSVSGLLGFRATLPEISENYSNKSGTSQFSSEVCISNNAGLGFFLLQSFLDKKYPLPKFCSVTPEEALANTLNIVEEFKKTLKKTAKQSDVLVKDVNFFKVYLDVAGHVRNERYSQIPHTLYSVAKEACLKNEKFLNILKGNIEKMFDEQEIINSKYQANDIVDNKPRSYLNNTTVDKQLQESYYAISS
ncbi:ankyrin repeat domain-containing protein [Wolbachia pipientis]|nr:ankyrin repeat domain-containing protein [Wolbachia pipientis]